MYNNKHVVIVDISGEINYVLYLFKPNAASAVQFSGTG